MPIIDHSKRACGFLLFVFFIIQMPIVFSQELTRYSCFVDRVFVDEFEKMKGKSFDSIGIIKQNNHYHPLTIAQYGVLCHNEFIETGDSAYFYKCQNQVAYFRDSTKIHYLFDGKAIGLPYNFKALDMKPPWYSGMTQGYAISFLLRYYELTQDDDVPSLVEKIAYLLKLPVKDGGVISITKEGFKFIEEYPNSRSHPQVLNGAINGIIGMKEYCDFFPQDTAARVLFFELYDGLKESIPLYDTPNWSTYSRRNQRLTNLYMRYQINEMEHLYNLFQDEFFYNQLMIWSFFAYKKPNKGILYKRGDLNYSIPLTLHASDKSTSLVKIDTISSFLATNTNLFLFKRARQVDKYFSKGKIPKRKFSKSRFKVFDLKQDTIIKLLELMSIPDDKGLEIGTFNQGFKGLNYEIIDQKNDTVLIKLDEESEINNIVFYQSKLSKTLKAYKLGSLFNYSEKSIPFFSHSLSQVYSLKKNDHLKISAEYIHAKKMRIFYRTSALRQNISKVTWKAKNKIEGEIFEMPYDGYCQFLIMFDIENPFFRTNNINFEIIN